MSTLQEALINAGFAEEPKPRRKRKPKTYKCKVCGSSMIIIDNSNVMVCSGDNLKEGKTCKNFFLFDNKKSA